MAVDSAKLGTMIAGDLVREAEGLREEIWKLRLNRATGKSNEGHRLRRVRRDLARVLTVQREQELAAGRGSGK
jgi:large subunit ribosomal protein L29